MPPTIHPMGLNHFNLVLPEFHTSLNHFRTLYDADFLMDLPGEGYHAGIFEIGRVIFEIFSPAHWLMNARYGSHYLGVEYQANMDDVREAIAARGIRIVRDIGAALHTHPDDTLGVAFEFYDGTFHNNTYALLGGAPMRSAGFWEDKHPLGLTGLKSYTLAVENINASAGFLQEFLAGTLIYQQARPVIGAEAIGIEIAGSVVELQCPAATGILRQHLYSFGEGIRAVIFGVKDLNQVQRYFNERGIQLVTGDRADALAVPDELNLGIRFEFSE